MELQFLSGVLSRSLLFWLYKSALFPFQINLLFQFSSLFASLIHRLSPGRNIAKISSRCSLSVTSHFTKDLIIYQHSHALTPKILCLCIFPITLKLLEITQVRKRGINLHLNHFLVIQPYNLLVNSHIFLLCKFQPLKVIWE